MGEDSDPDGDEGNAPSDADETTPSEGAPDAETEADPVTEPDSDASAAGDESGDDANGGNDAGDAGADADDAGDVGADADDAGDAGEEKVAADDGEDEDAADTGDDPEPNAPDEDELQEARAVAPPLDREEAVTRREDADDAGEDSDADGDTDADAAAVDAGGSADVTEPTAEGLDEDPYGMNEAADEDEELFEGPESDEEMPLAVHIEEMMRRLGIVFLFGGIATLIAFPTATDLIEYFWQFHIPEPMANRPRLYGPLELVLTRLKVAGLAGVVVGLPVFVYETYRFMRPGLYRKERRYYLAAVPTSLILGSIGILFAHFLVLPAIFSYFTTYTTGAAVIAFGLAETFNLIVVMLSFMAVVFQIPLFIMLAIMMNLVTRRWLEQKRLVFWGVFLGIAFLFSPDPTGMAPIIVTLTMIVLYEGTLALLRWTGN